MPNWSLYALWGCFYVFCVGLGTVHQPQGVGKVLFCLTALCFFVPPAILMYRAKRRHDRKNILALRVICLSSLGATLVLLAANFLSAAAGAQTGKLLYDLLNLVSAPMLCGQYWAASLFLWACLLWSSFLKKA